MGGWIDGDLLDDYPVSVVSILAPTFTPIFTPILTPVPIFIFGPLFACKLGGGGPALQLDACPRRGEGVVEEQHHLPRIRARQMLCRSQYGDGPASADSVRASVTHSRYPSFLLYRERRVRRLTVYAVKWLGLTV